MKMMLKSTKMKNKLKLYITFIVLLIVLVFTLIYFIYKPCKAITPEKYKNIPASAIWKGGCDGGCWIELVNNRFDTFRFRIYFDSDGTLWSDCDNTQGIELTADNWDKYITGYNGSTILSSIENIQICPIYSKYQIAE